MQEEYESIGTRVGVYMQEWESECTSTIMSMRRDNLRVVYLQYMMGVWMLYAPYVCSTRQGLQRAEQVPPRSERNG